MTSIQELVYTYAPDSKTKINTLTDEAAVFLRTNLDNLGIPYAPTGTAFLFYMPAGFNDVVLDGCYGGDGANIEDQSDNMTDWDEAQLRKVRG